MLEIRHEELTELDEYTRLEKQDRKEYTAILKEGSDVTITEQKFGE